MQQWHAATVAMEEREEKIAAASDAIERDLQLMGATAVEDKLQDGVPEAVDALVSSGIKVWVMTGGCAHMYMYMPCMHTVYDRVYGDFSAYNTGYAHRIYIYMYGSGQPYACVCECMCVHMYACRSRDAMLVFALATENLKSMLA